MKKVPIVRRIPVPSSKSNKGPRKIVNINNVSLAGL